jgi:hypothetical protein
VSGRRYGPLVRGQTSRLFARPLARTAAAFTLVPALAGCAGVREAPEEPAAAALRQARQMVNAQMRRDFASAVYFAHPAALEHVGGRERAIVRLRALMQELEDAGGTWHGTTVSPAAQMVSERGTIYVVLPTRTRFSLHGRHMSGTSYLLGISIDAGTTWKFADGVGLMHGETRRKLFPSLPSTLVLPVPEVPGFTAPP